MAKWKWVGQNWLWVKLTKLSSESGSATAFFARICSCEQSRDWRPSRARMAGNRSADETSSPAASCRKPEQLDQSPRATRRKMSGPLRASRSSGTSASLKERPHWRQM